MEDATGEHFMQTRKWILVIFARDPESFYKSVMICNSMTDIRISATYALSEQCVFLSCPHKRHCQNTDERNFPLYFFRFPLYV